MLTVLKEWSQMDSPQWRMVANLPGSFGSAVHRQWWDSWVAVVWPWMRKFSSDMEFCINTRFGWCNGIDFGQDLDIKIIQNQYVGQGLGIRALCSICP